MMGPKIRALPLALAAAFLVPASSAWASTFDFADFAQPGGGDGGVAFSNIGPGEGGYTDFWFETASGIRMTVRPNPADTPEGDAYYAYLDAYSGGLPGGLGVCSEEDCSGSPDDNVTAGEGLWLHFSEPVTISTVQFRNQDHGTTFGGGLFTVHSDLSGIMTPGLGTNVVLQLDGTDFYFDHNNKDFYIEKITFEALPPENPVPEPATLGLLGAGLLGLAARARRRRS